MSATTTAASDVGTQVRSAVLDQLQRLRFDRADLEAMLDGGGDPRIPSRKALVVIARVAKSLRSVEEDHQEVRSAPGASDECPQLDRSAHAADPRSPGAVVIVVEQPDLSSAWAATLEAVIDAGGSAVNVITSWPGTVEVPTVRDLLDTFISSRPTGSKPWPRWPVTTVANTIFADELYDDELGDAALEEFVELYLEGREFGRSVSPTGEYCERLVAWDGP